MSKETIREEIAYMLMDKSRINEHIGYPKYKLADEILAIPGLYVLADDQTPPTIYVSSNKTEYNDGFVDGERKQVADMLKENWRRIEL